MNWFHLWGTGVIASLYSDYFYFSVQLIGSILSAAILVKNLINYTQCNTLKMSVVKGPYVRQLLRLIRIFPRKIIVLYILYRFLFRDSFLLLSFWVNVFRRFCSNIESFCRPCFIAFFLLFNYHSIFLAFLKFILILHFFSYLWYLSSYICLYINISHNNYTSKVWSGEWSSTFNYNDCGFQCCGLIIFVFCQASAVQTITYVFIDLKYPHYLCWKPTFPEENTLLDLNDTKTLEFHRCLGLFIAFESIFTLHNYGTSLINPKIKQLNWFISNYFVAKTRNFKLSCKSI